ncbi:hypothetical protein F4703DRAFT_1928953 [Phycomyces blakesleeanus]
MDPPTSGSFVTPWLQYAIDPVQMSPALRMFLLSTQSVRHFALLVPRLFVLYAATHPKLSSLLCHSHQDNSTPFGHFQSITHLVIYSIELSSIPSRAESSSTTVLLHYLPRLTVRSVELLLILCITSFTKVLKK